MIRSPAGFDGGDRIKRYLDYYQPSYGVMMLSAGQFSPASLFAAGEQGAWYDPSDFSTMFQDSVGTTPVTAVEQPVGLILDKSKGLALGSELVTNGTFDTDTTGWTLSAGTATVSGGQVTISGAVTRFLTQAFTTVVGVTYKVTGQIVTSGATFNAIRKSDNATASSNAVTILSSAGTSSGYFVATATTSYVVLQVNDAGTATFDNISVKALAGNHASQSTSASRPVLSARVNLLTYSEQFDNAAWTKVGVTASGARITATAGTSAAYSEISVLNSPAASLSISVVFPSTSGRHRYVWIADRGVPGIASATFDLNAISVIGSNAGVTASASTLSDGSVRCVVTYTRASAGSSSPQFALAGASHTSDRPSITWAGGEFLDAKIDFRVTNDGVGIPAYQRIAAATDYDTSGFPLYLKFDGTDDTLLGSAVSDFISASAYEACVGARFNAVTTNNVNSWLNQSLVADSAGYVGIGMARSTGVVGAFNFDATQDEITVAMTPPATIVLQQRHSGGNLTVSTNQGAEVSTASGNTAALTGVLQLLKAFGSVFTNGRLYGVIIRNTAFTTAERANVLTWMNGKTKAY
jgi:hypothetical protein